MPLLKRAGTPAAPGVHPEPLWSVRPQSDRESGDAIVANFMLHWVPAKASRASLAWAYSFWLGTVSAALLLLLGTSLAAGSALALPRWAREQERRMAHGGRRAVALLGAPGSRDD